MTVWEAYDVLGLEPAASAEEVRRTYKNLLKKYHPDNNVNASPQSEKECRQRFERVKEAYDTIISQTAQDGNFHQEKTQYQDFQYQRSREPYSEEKYGYDKRQQEEQDKYAEETKKEKAVRERVEKIKREKERREYEEACARREMEQRRQREYEETRARREREEAEERRSREESARAAEEMRKNYEKNKQQAEKEEKRQWRIAIGIMAFCAAIIIITAYLQ